MADTAASLNLPTSLKPKLRKRRILATPRLFQSPSAARLSVDRAIIKSNCQLQVFWHSCRTQSNGCTSQHS
eukprot:180818-Amphidinium_carterae.1